MDKRQLIKLSLCVRLQKWVTEKCCELSEKVLLNVEIQSKEVKTEIANVILFVDCFP